MKASIIKSAVSLAIAASAVLPPATMGVVLAATDKSATECTTDKSEGKKEECPTHRGDGRRK